MRTVFMYAGQGSQYYQMGRALRGRGGAFAQTLERLDAVALASGGLPVLDAVHGANRKSELFDDTRLTNPAIVMLELALTRELAAQGVCPDLVLGYSLGTVAAACAAGCVSEADAVAAVSRQALLLAATCALGGMVAVLGDAAVQSSDPWLREHTVVAAVNHGSACVLAMPLEALDEACTVLKRHSLACQRLPVQYAFHSAGIDPSRGAMIDSFAALRRHPARLPLVSCADGRTHFELRAEDMWRSVREPVRFDHAVRAIERAGPALYVDVGPSGTLAAFARTLLAPEGASKAVAVMSPFADERRQFDDAVRCALQAR